VHLNPVEWGGGDAENAVSSYAGYIGKQKRIAEYSWVLSQFGKGKEG
jgi:hypothetical protein